MKVARLYGPTDIRVEEVPEPVLGTGEALIRVDACGVCPSDVRSYLELNNDGAKAPRQPWTPGHEVAGTVIEVDSDLPKIEVGSRVALDWRRVCGLCHFCRRGAQNFCLNLVKLPIRGFSSITLMPVAQLHLIPDGLSQEAASFCEPLACVLNAHRGMRIEMGSDVVIVGSGPIGLLHTQVAVKQGARVIVVDMLAERLDLARKLGAHDTIDASNTDVLKAVLSLTDGIGADAVILTVGAPPVIESSLRLAAKGGVVNLFAGTHPSGNITLSPDLPHYDQVSITGSHDYVPGDFATALKLLAQRIILAEPLVSDRFDLEHIVSAFEATISQEGFKSLVLCNA
jgi:L-iditol 2-dehydrogenase